MWSSPAGVRSCTSVDDVLGECSQERDVLLSRFSSAWKGELAEGVLHNLETAIGTAMRFVANDTLCH